MHIFDITTPAQKLSGFNCSPSLANREGNSHTRLPTCHATTIAELAILIDLREDKRSPKTEQIILFDISPSAADRGLDVGTSCMVTQERPLFASSLSPWSRRSITCQLASSCDIGKIHITGLLGTHTDMIFLRARAR